MTVRSERPVPGPPGDSARLLIAGDTHGNLDWISTLASLASRHGCSGILQLGDFGFWPDSRPRQSGRVLNDGWLDAVAATLRARGVWMRVIDGNHDAHPLVLANYYRLDSGLVPIRSGLLDWATRGTRWEWCGVRFGALGGAVSVDQHLRTPGISWWASEEITEDDLERLGGEPLDVLLTHEAPEGVRHPEVDLGSLPVQFLQVEASSRAQRRLVERARQATSPRLHLHGHHHHRYVRELGAGGVSTTVHGLGADIDGNGDAWAILELPSLVLADGWEVIRAAENHRPLDPTNVGRGRDR